MYVRPSVHGPLFVFADKSAVSTSYFSDVLRRCVQAAGLPINSYKPHSFRIGGATMAVQKGYTYCGSDCRNGEVEKLGFQEIHKDPLFMCVRYSRALGWGGS